MEFLCWELKIELIMILRLTFMRILLCVGFYSCVSSASGQVQTKILSTGWWHIPGTWQGGNVADLITEDVTFNAASGITATTSLFFPYTIGNVDLQSNTIVAQDVLNIGQAGTPKNVTAVGGSLNSSLGVITVWGDVNATGGFTFVSNKKIVIKGNVNLGDNARFNIGNNATIVIEGNLTAGQNTIANFAATATMIVTGDIVVSTGSSSNAPAGAMKSRTCTGPVAFCGNVVLPVQLFQFKATVAGDAVQVKWTTATEINVDYFTVQRSVEGQVFNDIGAVKAFGNSTVLRNYSLTDPNPLIGNVYYRLHSVDFDAREDFSNVVAVRYLSSKAIDVYPNPSAGNVTIRLNFNPGEETTHTLVDSFGRTIAHLTMHTSLGTFDIRNVKPGVYFLKTKTGDEVLLNRIVFTEGQ